MAHWGYPEPSEAGTVNIGVPEDLAEAVGAMIADPEAFFASLQQTEAALGSALVEVESGTWVAPAHIIAVQAVPDATRIHLVGGWVDVSPQLEPEAVLRRLQELLSEGGSTVGGTEEGAPPA